MQNVVRLVTQELERGDSGVRSFVSVQSALVMYPIYAFGSDEQKNTWLPALQKGEKLGCFGLTEPDFGSNPGGMRTRARKSGKEYILNGEKMWITSGTIADVAIIWAKGEDEDDKIRGFLVETDRPGFKADDIHGKWSLRASVTSGLSLQDVHIPESNLLPLSGGLKSPLMCLNQARIAWGQWALWRATAALPMPLRKRFAASQSLPPVVQENGMDQRGHKAQFAGSTSEPAEGRRKMLAAFRQPWQCLDGAGVHESRHSGHEYVADDYPIMRHLMNPSR
jgi:glutaryl-CoA dehydrogenase